MSKQVNLTPHIIAERYLDKLEKDIPLIRQCELLGIGRSSVYYQPIPISKKDMDLMRRIDKIHTDFPLLIKELNLLTRK